MAEIALDEPGTTKKKGLLFPLLIGVILAAGMGAGGYWATTAGPLAGMLSGGASGDSHAGGHSDGDSEYGGETAEPRPDLIDVAFVEMDPLVVSLGTGQHGRHLLFSAALEVAPDDEEPVRHLLPRVMDVMNSYLRVIDIEEIHDPRTLVRLRAQLLRRIQIVTGDALVRDLLITEFVVN